ncbi:hypothetical protein [Robertkochia aurantiaca]|uniref:hypothetical protein n=1 Tax=Robertkochia aurantiaca TaxID=2873700 RepID=UPI001CCCC09E|nr:hypothetical protein [Robertkochia sp. 3YJGBD-33]
MNLSNKQLSLIITFCIMGIFLLILFNIRMAGEKEEEFLYELSFDEELLEEIPQEEVKMTELETHQAYNEAAKSSYAKEIEEFKTLEELTQEMQENASEDQSPQDLDELSENLGLAKEFTEKLKKQKEMLQKNLEKGEEEKVNVKRRTTITYSLVDRMHRDLPNPIYTCESFGKVVINIKVDALGRVTDADFNDKSSTTDNGCLVENAIYYAKQARFDASSRSEQLGSITYLFQGE